MGNLFNPDNKFFTFMAKVADLMILNFLCIICCIPVITAGASITAMFYVTLKMVRGEETYIVKGFFHSFKQNFRQGIVIHLIMLVVGIILVFDLYFTRQMADQNVMYKVLTYVFMVGIVIYLMIFTYIYPMLAKFYNSVKNTFRNSLLMSIRHLPYTLLMMAVTVAPILIMIFAGQIGSFVILFYILMGFAVIAYINSRFFVKIFDRYIPNEEDQEEGEKEVEIDTSVFQNLQPTNDLPGEDNSRFDPNARPWELPAEDTSSADNGGENAPEESDDIPSEAQDSSEEDMENK